MNYIDLAVIITIVLMVTNGFSKGFIVSLLSMLRFIIGIPLAFFVSNMYYKQFYDSFLKEFAYSIVSKRLTQSNSLESIISDIEELTQSLPEIFSSQINLTSVMSIEDISRKITDTVVEPITLVVLKIVIFTVVFIAFYAVTGILISMLAKLQAKKHMPLKHTNALLGGIFGLVKAGAFIFAVASVFRCIIAVIPADSGFVNAVNSSLAIEFVGSNNPFEMFK